MRAWSERIMTEPKTMASAWLLTITIDEGYPGLSKPQNQNATATQMFTTLDGKIAASSGLASLLATAQLDQGPKKKTSVLGTGRLPSRLLRGFVVVIRLPSCA